VYPPLSRASVLLALLSLATLPTLPAPAGAQTAATSPAPKPATDLDAFMEKVLARRSVNKTTFNQYVLDETEAFELLGPGRWPLQRMKRDFTWYARDGMHVRSPVRFDGVAVGEAARREYEREWIEREKERQQRRAQKDAGKPEGAPGPDSAAGADDQHAGASGLAGTEPRFVSEAYFMDFKFEPGNYYLAGREKLEGHDVLRIEYYPTHLFNESDDEKRPREMKKDRGDRMEADIDRKMNKTALITLWVDPAEHQIVKYTFDNVWLDFLPGAWLVRIDDLRASMTMGQPFAGVWLPRVMNIHAGVTLATGSFEATYDRSFSNYREGDVKTIIKVPRGSARFFGVPRGSTGFYEVLRGSTGFLGGVPRGSSAGFYGVPQGSSGFYEVLRGSTGFFGVPRGSAIAEEEVPGHGPFVQEQPTGETIREIRIHGNASLTDGDVLQLAGVSVGDLVSASTVADIEQRLKKSGRFESVEVRKRYRSLDDPTDVALVLVVHERPGVTSPASGGTGEAPPAWRRLTSRLMFFPILGYEDGYGLTYGGRVSAVDLLGAGERLSVPLSWGGTKRAALEFERTFKTGPLTRVFSSFGIQNRENPHFDTDDQRVELKARAERQFAHLFRTGVEATRSSVSFGPLDDSLWTTGADAALDTRGDPTFPRNAVVLGGGWSALHVRGLPAINRYNADARGYLGVFRQNVLAGRVQYFHADATLPPYERLLLGGASTLRGFHAGAFDGDKMLVTSAELRAPITSVLHRARLGVTVFVDAAKAADFGAGLKDAPWHRGAGAGLFLIAPLVQINLDVAHGFDAGTRLSLGTGFSF
jgi:hypothetical protein